MEKIRFDDFIKLNRGFDLPDSQIEDGVYPVVASTNIKAHHSTYKVNGPMVVTGRSGSLGAVQYIEGKCWPLNTTLYVKDFKNNNPRYVYYFLKTMHLEQYNAGAGVPTLNQNHLHSLKINVHEKEDQRRIASILSAYDNLIENNNKRIRLLEQMAENLYKEWFAYHRIKNSAKEIRLTEVVSYSRGLSYSSEEIDCEDGNDLINLKNIQAFGGFRLDGTKKYDGLYKEEQIVTEGDLIMGVTDMTQDRRTVGSVALIPNITNLSVISADLIKLKSYIDNVYLYAMFRWGNVSRYISQFANGANVLHLRPQVLKNIKVMLPQKTLIEKYVSTVKPMIETINKLNTENDNLTRQRDLLLPRLMSGKLEVKVEE